MDRGTAWDVLQRAQIPKGTNFFKLNSDQVDGLLDCADMYKYRKPKNANGSRARYFHAMVERAASEHPYLGDLSRRTKQTLPSSFDD